MSDKITDEKLAAVFKETFRAWIDREGGGWLAVAIAALEEAERG